MPDIPYRPSVKLGSLRQTTKKMMVTKTGGAKVGEQKLKQFLKQDKGLRRVAYGDKSQTVESWKGRHFLKGAKENIETSDQFKETLYGKKTSAQKAFRDTVKEEIRQEQTGQPQGPNKDEQLRQHRIDEAKKHLRQYEQSKQIEKEQGKALASKSSDQTGTKQSGKGSKPSRATPLAGGGIGHIPPVGAGKGSGQPYAAPIGGGSASSAGPTFEYPPLFGLRGRTLRVDMDKHQLFVHVLNAPIELAIFIGRDLTIDVPPETHCWENGAPITFESIRVPDTIDVRGRTVNRSFVADELYRNNIELPGFVTQLAVSDANNEVPKAPPDDLAIG
ncbi:MAG: hypothetical protein V1907_04505 [Candidatus Kerfeldbacteria bacterium]